MTTLIYNGKVILEDRILDLGYLEIEGDTITKVEAGNPDKFLIKKAKSLVNAEGNYISPGFIDIHLHGGGGHEFGLGDENSFVLPCETHVKYGTTGLFPTISSYTYEIMENSVINYKKAKKLNHKGATMLGLHMEGPYFADAQRGAQLKENLRNPQESEYLKILDMTDDIKRWSGACELDGMERFAKHLKDRGIIAAVGHSDATYDEVKKAQEWGFSLITHLYSGCSTVRREKGYRIAGVVEAAYLLDDMDIEIICDGHHLPDSLIQFAYKFKGPEKTAVITDCLSFAGMNVPNGTKVREDLMVEDGVVKMVDRSAFGGSIATFDVLIRVLLKAGIPFLDIIKMSSLTPARIMNIDKITGSLRVGKKADVIVFDQDINMKNVFVRGEDLL